MDWHDPGVNPTTLFVRWATDYHNPLSLGSRMRRARSRHLLQLLESVHQQHGEVRILDVGGTPDYWNILPPMSLERLNLKITVLNLYAQASANSARFTFVQGDACQLDYADRSFHVVHSNSVIEHVGGWAKMQRFAAEVRRVGQFYYVQTPNFWFPIEPHFMMPAFHWLPRKLQVALLMRLDLGNHRQMSDPSAAADLLDHTELLGESRLKKLFPDAVIFRERLLLVKSFMAISS